MNATEAVTELSFKAMRSSGAGGQHVNKVSSKVELSFNISASNALRRVEKERLYLKLSSRLTKNNVLVLQCDESRSQHQNKDLVIKRFLKLITAALVIPKKRRPTKPKRSSIEKRLTSKRKASQKKVNRRKPPID